MIVAGTGHRPDKLRIGRANAYDAAVFARLVGVCAAELRRLAPATVIAGGALGFDEALAVAALEVRDAAGLALHLMLPFPSYDARWPEAARRRYAAIAARADVVTWVTPAEGLPHDPRTGARLALTTGQAAALLHRRNRAMVDAADRVLACWNGDGSGGTAGTVAYAAGRGRPVTNLWAAWRAAGGGATGPEAGPEEGGGRGETSRRADGGRDVAAKTGRALSVRQPWAWLLVTGHKDVENRAWGTNLRGWIGVHAGGTYDVEGDQLIRERFPQIALPARDALPRGGIVGRVRLVDCVTASDSPWFVGPYGFVVADGEPLPFRACPGRLGFFRPVLAA